MSTNVNQFEGVELPPGNRLHFSRTKDYLYISGFPSGIFSMIFGGDLRHIVISEGKRIKVAWHSGPVGKEFDVSEFSEMIVVTEPAKRRRIVFVMRSYAGGIRAVAKVFLSDESDDIFSVHLRKLRIDELKSLIQIIKKEVGRVTIIVCDSKGNLKNNWCF